CSNALAGSGLQRLPAEPFGAERFEEHLVAIYESSCPVLIEPEFGYVLLRSGKVVAQMLCWSELARKRGGMHLFSGVPSLRGFVAVRAGMRRPKRFPIAVLLRRPFDNNYYHAMVE